MTNLRLKLALSFIFSIVLCQVKGQSWSNLGCSVNGGTRVLIADGTKLYAAGTFSDKVMDYTITNGCSGLGYQGTLNELRAIAIYNGDLYAAGIPNIFADTGRVYKFSNGNWSTVGTYDGWVNTMTVYNGELYIAGGLGNVQGVSVSNIAKWNGTQWSSPGGGIPYNGNTQVRTMTVHNNELVVGGDNFAPFANDIARWNGSTWNTLAGGITGVFNTGVYALQSHNGHLYAGGHFTAAGGQPCSNIARWDGANWSSAGTGIMGGDTMVLSLASYQGELYAGGSFTSAGGVPCANIAKWNGAAWSSVGAGLSSSYVNAMVVYYGSLIAASGFSSPNFYYAVWQACPAIVNATGPTTVCGGGVPLAASAGTAYQWYRNNNLIFGASTANYIAVSSGNYKCVITNACGDVFSNTVSVTVNPIPAATVTPSGPTTFCSLGSVTLNANSGTGYTYKWYKYGNLLPGATSISYLASTSGKFKVEVTNVQGCTKKSPAVTVTVNPLPTAVISAGGSTSICAGDSVLLTATTNTPGSVFQWKRYANNIAGATSPDFYAKLDGAYKVVVTSPAGCSRTSNKIIVSVVCRTMGAESNEIAVYPNPVQSTLTIKSGSDPVSQILMADLAGSVIYSGDFSENDGDMEIDLSNVPSGIYFLKVSTAKGVTVNKIIKQ